MVYAAPKFLQRVGYSILLVAAKFASGKDAAAALKQLSSNTHSEGGRLALEEKL